MKRKNRRGFPFGKSVAKELARGGWIPGYNLRGLKMSLHFMDAGKMICERRLSMVVRTSWIPSLTKLSLISMVVSDVSFGAKMSKFLATAATVILNMICAKFWPPHTRDPVPNGIMLHAIVASAPSSAPSHQSGRNASGDGKTEAQRCVPTMVPGGRSYPIKSKASLKLLFFDADFGTTRSRRLGARVVKS